MCTVPVIMDLLSSLSEHFMTCRNHLKSLIPIAACHHNLPQGKIDFFATQLIICLETYH